MGETMSTSGSGLSRRSFMKVTASTLGTASVLGAPALAAGTRRLRYVTFAGRDTVWGKPYDFLSAEVDRMSGGDLQIDFIGGSEVIGDFDAPEAVANGVFDISHSGNAYFAGAMPSSIALASGNASREALEKSGAISAYSDILMKQLGVKLLGIPLSGVGYVFQVRGEPNDLSYFMGKKIRSIPLYDPILEALGATSVTTSPSEAYTAMERGVVDGLGWPDIGLLDFKFYEQAKFLMLPAFYQLRTASLINPNSFGSLPVELQVILTEAAASADKLGEEWARETRDAEHAEMAEAGVEFVTLPEDQAKQFIGLTEEKLWEKIATNAADDAARLRPLFEST